MCRQNAASRPNGTVWPVSLRKHKGDRLTHLLAPSATACWTIGSPRLFTDHTGPRLSVAFALTFQDKSRGSYLKSMNKEFLVQGGAD